MSRTTELVDDNSFAALEFLASVVCRADASLIDNRWTALCACGAAGTMTELASRFSIEPVVSAFLSSRADALRNEHSRRVIVSAIRNAQWRDASLALLSALVSDPQLDAKTPVIVKGAALQIGGWYAGDRYFVDADLLIEEKDLERWIAAASAAGADVQRGTAGAYEAAYVSRDGGLVEIHVALAGAGGSDWGPLYGEVLRKCRRVEFAGREVAIPLPGVAREIAVHHFVFHHHGEPLHAMRALQDLAVLESEPDESALDWGASSPAASVAKLRRVVRQVREGGGAEAEAFLRALAAVLATEDPATRFADSVDLWMESRRSAGKSAPLLVLHRIFPPWNAVKVGNEPVWRTATRYLTRPPHLLTRYLVARRRRTASLDEASGRWRETLKGN